MNSSKKGVSLLPMELAAMQEQLNQLQQLSQRMAQALGTQLVQPNSVTPVAGHQHSQNISSNQQLSSSTLNLMQEMLSSIQAQQGQQSSMTTPIRKPENVQQMLTILQRNPQLLQALITKTQSLTSEAKTDPAKQANFPLTLTQVCHLHYPTHSLISSQCTV
ncbi:hypothetical protein EB796_004491 [Bugula neritina]|uniref:Uncharacterized protein n=1 Tax=Bugula neritina TaxID=10212 RepID=A0A7J7KEY8_BUGNE|nr:hypothetical protein EB796_004491 [Bugula neritina]